MAAPPYQKLFWGSYHKHTAHLSNACEHGAYLLLIGALWNNEGRLPSDDVTLAGYAKLTVAEWEAIRPKLINGRLLKIVRGKLTQPRVTEDLAKYRDTSGKRKEAGKAGGLASRGKITGNAEAFASVLPTKPEPESKEEPPNPLEGGGLFSLLPEESEPVDDVTQAFRLWNDMAGRCGLPIAEDLTDARRRSIGKRLERGGLKAWRVAMAAVEASAFCRGQVKPKPDEKPFRAHIDFVCQPSSFQKLIEGFYGRDAKAVEAVRPAADPNDVWRRRVRAWLTGSRYWNTNDWEAPPGKQGCIVPVQILAEFNIVPPLVAAAGERAA